MQNSENIAKQYMYSQSDLTLKNAETKQEEAVEQNNSMIASDAKAEEEYNLFMQKVKQFETIDTIAEAKELGKKLFNIKDEISYLRAGNAYITIQTDADLFRIIINSENELICYNFNRAKE